MEDPRYRPGTPEAEPSQAFDQLYRQSEPRNVDRNTFDAQNFDAVILCYLAAVAAGSTDGQEMADQLQDITGPQVRSTPGSSSPTL